MTTTVSPDLVQTLNGTWDIDQSHSEVSFVIRHLMVSKVRGTFNDFSGSFVVGDSLASSSVQADVDLASIDTNSADRDAHVRSADFFDVEQYPTMSYRSTAIRPDGDDYVVDGELSLRGVTRPVALKLEVLGFVPETPFGDTRVGFSATGEIDRRDFGLEWNAPVNGGGVVLGHKIPIALEIEAIRRSEA
ncbi:MAG: YceI family protein [Acidimicrobiia bacterium]|jgi:polyisoprenoid-binding protein YceI